MSVNWVAVIEKVQSLAPTKAHVDLLAEAWARTVSTCGQLLKQKEALWTFLEIQGIKPTNNAAERALRQAVIHRKISHGVQSAQGALCRGRLLTVVPSLRQQGGDIWPLLEQAWIAHHRGAERPSLLPDP